MSSHKTSDLPTSNRFTIPRWIAILIGLLVWWVGVPLTHGLVPWSISLLMNRFGWITEHPKVWNLFGLVPVAVGTVLLVWTWLTGLWQVDRIPERVKLDLTPIYLMNRGPYRLTRNPMYAAELALWFGWAIFYGSIGVLIGFLTLLGLMVFVAVPHEERTLEAHFGESYLQYKKSVPRWIWVIGR